MLIFENGGFRESEMDETCSILKCFQCKPAYVWGAGNIYYRAELRADDNVAGFMLTILGEFIYTPNFRNLLFLFPIIAPTIDALSKAKAYSELSEAEKKEDMD